MNRSSQNSALTSVTVVGNAFLSTFTTTGFINLVSSCWVLLSSKEATWQLFFFFFFCQWDVTKVCCEGFYGTFYFSDIKRENHIFAKNVYISLEIQQPSCNHNAINIRKKSNTESLMKQNEKRLVSWWLFWVTEPVLRLPSPWVLICSGKKRNTYVFILLLVSFSIICS